jgi:hypothetical protein
VINEERGIDASILVSYDIFSIWFQVRDVGCSKRQQTLVVTRDSMRITAAAGGFFQGLHGIWIGRYEAPREMVGKFPY